jgi:hypothetical protein
MTHLTLAPLFKYWHWSLFTTGTPDSIWSRTTTEWSHSGGSTTTSSSTNTNNGLGRRVHKRDATPPPPDAENTEEAHHHLCSDALEALQKSDPTLSLKPCRHGEACYGRYSRCPFLHTLPDTLAVFRRDDLLALYREGRIKPMTGDQPPKRWVVREASEFQCHNTAQCGDAKAEYSLRLQHDTGTALRHPVCRVFCAHCRKTRSLPVYV